VEDLILMRICILCFLLLRNQQVIIYFARFSFLVSRFSFLVSRFSFLVSRFSFLVSRFSFPISYISFIPHLSFFFLCSSFLLILYSHLSSDKHWNTEDLRPNVATLSPTERKKHANEWIELGKSEHASVASFSLFAQKLLAVGAPPHLVSESLTCALEEIDHARFSFSLASAFYGHPVAPSTYSAHSITVFPDLLSLVEDTIKEGCVQEMVSALEAGRRAVEEQDEVVKRVWEKVVEDEAHHAACLESG
jgi:hypothetical protein